MEFKPSYKLQTLAKKWGVDERSIDFESMMQLRKDYSSDKAFIKEVVEPELVALSPLDASQKYMLHKIDVKGEEEKEGECHKVMQTLLPKLKIIFGGKRIVALCGDQSSGKTNNIVSLVVDLRKYNESVPVYAYGMPPKVMEYLKNLGVVEISKIDHLVNKKDSIIILDEFHRLRLNDKRYKEQLSMVVDLIYHNNNYLLLSSPNIREFNSIIGSPIERWVLKNVSVDSCVNGSQLKRVVEDYRGVHRQINNISVPLNKLLLINEESEMLINCEYIEEVDVKKENKVIF